MALQNPTLTPNFSNIHFNFEPFLRKEYNFALDPDRPQCKFYDQNGACPNGANCFNKHVSPMFRNKVVCKHWLRGLCKKGDSCDYLHEYNLRKMPECLFFSKNGFCTQTPECIYLHIDPQTKIPECFNYNKGFCPDGPKCNKRHIRKAICELYLTGFCPYGMKCNMGSHPRFEGIMGRMRITPDKVKELQKEEKTKEEDKLANDNVAAAENVDDGNEEDDYKPEDHELTEPPANEEPNKLKRAAADSEEDSETPKKKART